MGFSAETIEKVRRASDLVEVAGAVVQLKRVGSNFRGLSPFKKEKTPSFYVHPDKQFFKCFSTGTGGDVFRFLMMTEGLDFPTAVRRLAERAGVHLEEEAGGGGGGEGGERCGAGATATNSRGVGSSLARFVGKRSVCGECAGLFKRERDPFGVDCEVWAGVCTCGMDCDLGLGKEKRVYGGGDDCVRGGFAGSVGSSV